MRLRTRGAWWNVFVLVLGFVCCNNFFKGWMSVLICQLDAENSDATFKGRHCVRTVFVFL